MMNDPIYSQSILNLPDTEPLDGISIEQRALTWVMKSKSTSIESSTQSPMESLYQFK
jgi:hypothetical protein